MTTSVTPSFDPRQAVPDEYNVFCMTCGYSLVGLTGNRCPECGEAFELDGLSYAHVPWLHRRRLGTLKAYLRTVAFVSFRPRQFGRELSRPVHVSLADAKAFRRLTLWLTTFAFAAVILMLPVVAVRTYATQPPIATMIFSTIATLIALSAFHLFIRLATDMPLFIWKGLSRTDLSPVHYYACAPLGILPVVGVSLGAWFYALLETNFRLENRFIWVCTGLSLIWLTWMWIVAIQLMMAYGQSSRKHIALLAIYLPFHWLVTLATSILVMFLAVMTEHRVAHWMLN